eukprot:scaffold12516_cov67-Skeletonema_dohrnii-CCMP3373.AAC.1
MALAAAVPDDEEEDSSAKRGIGPGVKAETDDAAVAAIAMAIWWFFIFDVYLWKSIDCAAVM